MISKNNWFASRARRIALGAAAIGITIVSAGAAEAQDCRLFGNSRFNGFNVSMNDGQGFSRLTGFLDRRVSSVGVRPGCSVTLFSGREYSGDSATFDASQERLPRDWNNRARSASCACGRGRGDGGRGDGGRGDGDRGGRDRAPETSRNGAACIVFEDRRFGGRFRAFERGDRNERLGRRLRGDVSSVQVARGCTAILDVDRPYRIRIEGDTRRLPSAVDDRATSITCRCRR